MIHNALAAIITGAMAVIACTTAIAQTGVCDALCQRQRDQQAAESQREALERMRRSTYPDSSSTNQRGPVDESSNRVTPASPPPAARSRRQERSREIELARAGDRRALEWLLDRVERDDDPIAGLELGRLYKRGIGVMQNHGSAQALFTDAANNARALRFDASRPFPEDFEYRRAAAEAAFEMYTYCGDRRFTAPFAQLPPDCANWIRHAAAYGFGPAELILGGLLYTNRVSTW